MTIRGYEFSLRLILIIAAAIFLVVASALFVRSCDKRRSQAAQARVERSQAEAQSNSAADAIGTVQRSGEVQAASEELSRQNEKEIRDAKGSDAKVDPAVRDAGIRSLCKRSAYRDSPRCKLLQPHP